MAKRAPRTKAGKKAKREKVLSEFKADTLRSGSGQRVTNRDQAIAIALSESGEARGNRARKNTAQARRIKTQPRKEQRRRRRT